MPANAIMPQVSAVDQTGEAMVPWFGQGQNAFTDPFWYCRFLEDGSGSEPGMAEVVINNDQGAVDEVANVVALNQFANWSLAIVQGSPLTVYRRFFTTDQDGNPLASKKLMFAGKVADVYQDSENDSVILQADDFRTELRKIRIAGRVVYPNQSDFNYQDGWPCHFNPGGRPNCIFDTKGRPWFSPYPDFGLDPSSGEQPPAPSSKNISIACYWTLGNIMLYLRNVYGPGGPPSSTIQNDLAFFPYVSQCPSWITWPDTFATGLDSEVQANFDSGVGQNNSALGSNRKGRDLNLTGLYLCGDPKTGPGAFDMIFATAGGWTWTLDYSLDNSGNIVNTLKAIPSRFYSVQKSINIPYAAAGQAASVLNTKVATRVKIRESSRDIVTRAVGRGALVKIETRVQSPSGGLVQSWIDSRLASMLQLAVTLGGDEKAFNLAAAQYPECLTTMQLDGQFNFMTGTEFASFPRAKIARPVWPFLLSFQGGATGPRDSQIKPYPIRVEVDTSGGGNWVIATEYTGLEVLDNGEIYMPALRELPILGDPIKPGLWRWNTTPFNTTTAGPYGAPGKPALDIVVNNVRCTLAIPCDHRVTYCLRTAQDQTPAGNTTQTQFDVNNECPDSAKLDPSLSRTAFYDLQTLYELWIQYQAYPVPQGSGGTLKSNAALRDDRTLLQSHVRRNLREQFRLNRDGSIVYFDGTFMLGYPAGTQCRQLVPMGNSGSPPYLYDLNAVVKRRRWFSDRSTDENGIDSFKNRSEMLLG